MTDPSSMSSEELREIAAELDVDLPDDDGYVLDDDEDEPEGF